MNASASDSLHGYPTKERGRFLYLMMREPDNYLEWVEQFTSRTISRLSWGSPHPAPVLRKTTFGLLETISPSGALPNVISWLALVPEILSPWKKKEKARHRLEEKLLTGNVEFVKRKMDDCQAEPSFTRTFLQTKGNESLTINEIAEATHVVGIMAIAGALTIGSPIQSYILAMCHYPLWQARLQHEIDSTLGGQCPEWQDREKLPLLRAVIKEVLRWRPPVPTGGLPPFILNIGMLWRC
jgi:cytochrome P450